MSYILEALKKAESERQLGAVPNVHAQTSSHADSEGRRSTPWIIGLLLLLAVLLAALLWRSFATPGPAVGSATSAAPVQLAAVPASLPTGSSTSLPNTTPAAQVPPAQNLATPAPAVLASPIPTIAPSATPTPRLTPAATPLPNTMVAASAPKAVAAAPVVAVTPTPPVAPARPGATEAVRAAEPVNTDLADEQLPFMAQLPEAIVREVPQVQIKGFIYSKTPAERSLLVGGNLYHEGDDVASGVRLEKLLPRAAVMNYRGFRYRIAY